MDIHGACDIVSAVGGKEEILATGGCAESTSALGIANTIGEHVEQRNADMSVEYRVLRQPLLRAARGARSSDRMILEVMGLTNGYCYHYYVTGQKCRFRITNLAWLVGQGSLVSVVPTFDPGGKTQHTGEMANPDHAGSL